LQFLDGQVELKQLAAQFELRQYLMRQRPERSDLLVRQLTRFEINDTQGSQCIAFAVDQRGAAIEFEIWLPGNEWNVIEPLILPQVGRHDHFSSAHRRCAECDLARALIEARRQPVFGFEPQSLVVHQAE
jgi:hypothetical protein